MRHRLGIAAVVLWATACATAPVAPADTDDTSRPWVNPCDAIRVGMPKMSCVSGIRGTPYPSSGMTDVAPTLTFTLDFITDERETACVELSDGLEATALAPASWTEDGRSMWFRPLTPLEPDTDYTLTVYYSCDRAAPITFHTAKAGGPIDPSTLLNAAWVLDPSSGHVIGPPGYGAVLQSLIKDDALVFVPTAHDPVQDRLRGFEASADADGAQDVCVTTPAFELAFDARDGAVASIMPMELDLPLRPGVLHLREASFSGTVVSDGSSVVSVDLDGSLDVRDAVAGVGGRETTCAAAAEWSSGVVTCGPCPDDGEDFCLPFHLVNGVAQVQPWSVAPIDQAAVDANSECRVDVAAAR